MKRSALRISSSRAFTHRFSAVFPCLMPMPYGSARNGSFVSFELRSAAAIPTRTESSHISASARPWLNVSAAFVKLSVTVSFALGKHFRTHRS